MRISGSQWVVAGTTLLVLLTGGLVARAVLSEPDRPAAARADAPAVSIAPAARDVDAVHAVASLALLRDWDRARAAAWAAGDPGALGRLYLPGSSVGRADLRMLRRWTTRGLHVEGMTMQVTSIVLHERTRRRLVLVVTDRLVGAVAVGPQGRTELPRDQPTTRRLVFQRSGGRWLLAAAREVSSG